MTAPLDSEQIRDLLLRALSHDAVEDAVTELLFEHVVGGRFQCSEVAALLRLRIQGNRERRVWRFGTGVKARSPARRGGLLGGAVRSPLGDSLPIKTRRCFSCIDA
jgi:hypothetical protein